MFNTLEFAYILRIVIAGLCGVVVGLERRNRAKEAGIRTHFIVACGAAIIMVVSKYAFFDAAEIAQIAGASTEVRVDPSRVASTIASGIGFLGAGMIFVHKNTITGLTTAAGIWATSGIGMAIGSGMYVFGIGATFVILLAQILLHLKHKNSLQSEIRMITIYGVEDMNFKKNFQEKLNANNLAIQSVSIDKNGNRKNYTFAVEMLEYLDEEKILSEIEYDYSIKTIV